MAKQVILCVDDELDGLIGRESLLKLKGYDVLSSTDPSEALKLFATYHVDGVVLDYQMPEICGDVVASRMKRLKPNIPIMLLSAHDSFNEDTLEKVDMFLSKREPPRAFVAAVQVLLARPDNFFSKWLRNWQRRSLAA